MIKYSKSIIRNVSVAFSLIALSTGSASAAFVYIDFGRDAGEVQPGFVEQTSADATYTTPEGDIDVNASGLFWDRSATSAYADALLYGDFAYENNLAVNALTLTIDGAGILADTDYEIEFFSYDSQHGGGGGLVTYTGLSGTTGGTSIAYSNAFVDDNAATAIFTSNGSGEIVIGVTGTTEGPRVSGMIINSTPFVPIPEPSTTALLGLGGLALILRRRK